MLREANARQGFYEPDQLAAVIGHLPPCLRRVIEFAAVTGWRVPSEVLPLTWGQVDLKAREVRLEPNTTKNTEGRTFVIGPLRTLREVLEHEWAEHEALKKRGVICPYVFPRNGKRIKIIKHAWDAAARAAGCPGRIPHDLRRTAIRAMVRAGISQHIAMKMSGHKTDSVFRRYAIISTQDLTEAAAKLAAASGQ
jgi:integrase